MKTSLFCLPVGCLISFFLNAQTLPTVLFEKTIGLKGDVEDQIFPLPAIATKDDGLLVVGYSESDSFFLKMNSSWDSGDRIPILMKFDRNGYLEWNRGYGGSKSEGISDFFQLPTGDFLICGASSSTNDEFANNHGRADAWLMRIAAKGNIVWSKTFGGKWDDAFVKIYPEGDNFLITGIRNRDYFFTSGGLGGIADTSFQFWFTRFNENGELLSSSVFEADSIDGWSGITKLSNGEILFTGTTKGVVLDTSNPDYAYENEYFIIDPADAVLQFYHKVIDENIVASLDDTYEYESGYVSVGNWNKKLHSIQYDFAAVQYDKDFNPTKQLLLGGSDFDLFISSFQTRERNIILHGYSYSEDGDLENAPQVPNTLLVCIDSNLNVLWKKVVGGRGDEQAYAMLETYSGNGFWLFGTKSDSVFGIDRDQNFWLTRFENPPAAATNACADISVSPNLVLNGATTRAFSGTFPGNEIQYRLFDSVGRLVQKGELNLTDSPDISIEKSLAAGAYFLQFICESGSSISKLIIVSSE